MPYLITTGQTEGLKGGFKEWVDGWVCVWDGGAYYLLQYIYFPCNFFTWEINQEGEGLREKKNWFLIFCDGEKGKTLL
jgi:hypothetical protein